MRNTRIFQQGTLNVNQTITLNDNAFGHAIRVLRLSNGDNLTLFNGTGIDYLARLVNVTKKAAQAEICQAIEINNESPLSIHLGQGISRGDRMDFTLQKSVELGVSKITPIFTERCGVKLQGERLSKKHEQWQKIVISACEQSGRSIVPEVMQPISLEEWINQDSDALKINLHPRATESIMTLDAKPKSARLLIGPEGGLSEDEINAASSAGFLEVLLGPRVLRTETAALTAITSLQCRFGDIN